MKKIKLSIIVPFYNCEPFIEETMLSLTNKIPNDVEIIMVDDCGTDNGRNIVHAFAARFPQIKVLENPHNLGIGKSENKAIKAANGEYITFCFADDFVVENYYELIMPLTNGDQDIVIFDHFKVNEEGKFMSESIEFDYYFKTKQKMIHQPALNLKLIKADIIKNIAMPDGIYEDMAIWPQIFNSTAKIKFANFSLMNYRSNQFSIMRKKFDDYKIDQYFHQWQYIIDNNKLSKEIYYYIYRHSIWFLDDYKNSGATDVATIEKRVQDFLSLVKPEDVIVIEKYYELINIFLELEAAKTLKYAKPAFNEITKVATITTQNEWNYFKANYRNLYDYKIENLGNYKINDIEKFIFDYDENLEMSKLKRIERYVLILKIKRKIGKIWSR